MTADNLESLQSAIAAGSGPDRELDAAFACYVMGWAARHRKRGNLYTFQAGDGSWMTLPAFTDALAGPGALFAAARESWPDAWISVWCRPSIMKALVVRIGDNHGSHPDLCRAMMLAMVVAKIERGDAK